MTRDRPADDVLGVILAGGENRRYGDHKAFATLGDHRIIDLVVDAVGAAVDQVTVVANDLDLYGSLGLPVRCDRLPGTGVLGGILTAVLWAKDRGCQAALVTACDMPFLNPSLLRELVRRAESDKVWLPESHGPRGVEPLCGAYGTECAGEIERTLERGDRTVVQALSGVDRRILPLEVVGSHGDPDLLFLNVNRPADRSRAEQVLAERGREAAENGCR